MNHTSIYSVFSKCLCNLNARFTPIFLKITLIHHFMMFCRIKRKIKQGKGKKLRRKNLVFKALVCRGKKVRQGEEKASPQRSPSKQKKKPRVRLGEEGIIRRNPLRFSQAKHTFAEAKHTFAEAKAFTKAKKDYLN